MNYALWLQGGGGDVCPLCLHEQRENKTPLHLRTEQPLPCPKHGDPRRILPELYIICDLYSIIRSYHTMRVDRDSNPLCFLNIPLIRLFCRELKLDFVQTFERLDLLHGHLDGKGNT